MATLIDKIPKPKETHIQLLEVKKIAVPHPYCITPKHLTGTSMVLDQHAIRDAEKTNKAVCDICRQLVKKGRQNQVLSYDEHTEALTLFLEVPKDNLNNIKGLHQYLLRIKPVLMKLNIKGIAFKPVDAKRPSGLFFKGQ